MTIKVKEIEVESTKGFSSDPRVNMVLALAEPALSSRVDTTSKVREFLGSGGMDLHHLVDNKRNNYATRVYDVVVPNNVPARVASIVLEKVWLSTADGVASTLGVMFLEKNIYEGKTVEFPSLGITLTRENLIGNNSDLD